MPLHSIRYPNELHGVCVCVRAFSKEAKPVFRLDDLLPECILFQRLSLASTW